jgi:type II secretory pathway pseudopilin PulG
VVIAIIGVLIALLLPAVQAAREAARRMQCSNHLKQFGIALHNYHDVHGTFPALRCQGGTKGSTNWTGIFSLFPFMEQQSAYDTIIGEMGTNAGPDPVDAPTVGKTRVATLCCPSDYESMKINDQAGYECYKTSIMMSVGDVINNNYIDNPPDTIAYTKDSLKMRGMFFSLFWKGLESVSDGTSNTIVASESVCTDTTSSTNPNPKVKGGTVYDLTIWTGGTTATINPSICIGKRSSSDPTLLTTTLYRSFRGARIFDGRTVMIAFVTSLPPNSPNCLYTDNLTTFGFFSTSSFHSGGVNSVLADGSGRFISETINCGNLSNNYKPIDYYQGTSPFGIWGALGSLNGGETVTVQ